VSGRRAHRAFAGSSVQVLTGKHPVTRCQHVLRVELRLRRMDGLPGRSVVALPIVLRHLNRARRHSVAAYVARPFIECAIERDHGYGVGPRRQNARKLEPIDDLFIRHAGERALDGVLAPRRHARNEKCRLRR